MPPVVQRPWVPHIGEDAVGVYLDGCISHDDANHFPDQVITRGAVRCRAVLFIQAIVLWAPEPRHVALVTFIRAVVLREPEVGVRYTGAISQLPHLQLGRKS